MYLDSGINKCNRITKVTMNYSCRQGGRGRGAGSGQSHVDNNRGCCFISYERERERERVPK